MRNEKPAMRRKEKEITAIEEKLEIIRRSKICRLGLAADNQPYIVPLNFGFTYEDEQLTLYFHSAKEGHKIDIIKENRHACFEMELDYGLIEGKHPCSYSYAFASIIGSGTIEFIQTSAEKTAALNALMKHQTGQDTEHQYPEKMLQAIALYKLNVTEFTGKGKLQ